MSGGPLLMVDGLGAGYGRAAVLFDVALRVAEGEVVLLMGRNGAGKSTTLRAIMGLVPAATGRVAFEGREAARLAAFERSRLGLGWVPEDRRVFPDLTVEENLAVGRQPPRPGLQPWTIERLFDLFPALLPLRRRAAGRMSGGEQQMLSIARTLMGNPRLLLLDEPSEGLAPLVVSALASALRTLRQQGLAVLLAEQNPHFAGPLADRAYVIERGRIARALTRDELLAGDAAALLGLGRA